MWKYRKAVSTEDSKVGGGDIPLFPKQDGMALIKLNVLYAVEKSPHEFKHYALQTFREQETFY